MSERKIYFIIPEEVAKWTQNIASPIALVGFIILYGYAQSKLRFFHPNTFSTVDIEFVCNKIELSNKFAKAISFDDNNEMQYGSKEEQEMAINCQMLIQNAIILWNELYLSQKLVNTNDLFERDDILTILGNSSIQSWGHINFSGEYDFTGVIDITLNEFDLDKILALQI